MNYIHGVVAVNAFFEGLFKKNPGLAGAENSQAKV
jgi:hypothetical protein